MKNKPSGHEDNKPRPHGTSRTFGDPPAELPHFAVIGGSQAFRFLKTDSGWNRLGAQSTPFGESQPIYHVRSDAGDYLFISRHGEKGYAIAASFVNYRANIYALKDLGVSRIVAWSGPGTLTTEYHIGQFAIIDDIIDETRRRPGTFFERGGLGFIRQNPVFCPHLRRLLEKTLSDMELDYESGGTYVCTEGPRLETPAEIRKFALYGAQFVGMTLVPEVFLAKELEMCYAALCYITNYAEGVKEKSFQPGVLFEGLASRAEFEKIEASVERFPAIAEAMAGAVSEFEPDCICSKAMKRYRDRGDIGENWREWIRQ
jgi:5'-methylthioadenosine phosphorylase